MQALHLSRWPPSKRPYADMNTVHESNITFRSTTIHNITDVVHNNVYIIVKPSVYDTIKRTNCTWIHSVRDYDTR